MRLTFVTPAWRRSTVTRLVLAQRRHLCDALSSRGITAGCIVVADDDNLDVAREFGFDTLERANLLGYKINEGFRIAAAQGADYVSFVGSDDWMHPDLFDLGLMDGRVVTGSKLCQYDLSTHVSKIVGTRSPFGVIPWLIPATAVEDKMVSDHLEHGIDLELGLRLSALDWVFHDPHPLARVDFKSNLNMTPYGAGLGPVAPPLSDHYPADLVSLVDDFALVAA